MGRAADGKERRLALLFMGAFRLVKQYGLKVDVDRFLEACRDYFAERGLSA